MAVALQLIGYVFCITSVKPLYLPGSPSRCNLGEILRNSCKTCECTSTNIYKCSDVSCDERYKEMAQSLQAIHGILKSCEPNMIYRDSKQTCRCSKDGAWPHLSCSSNFGTLLSKNSSGEKCKPNGYITVNCNVCRCDEQGRIDTTRCTRNECVRKTRRSKNNNDNYNCNQGSWYSLSPCQICYCNNKNELVCNTGSTEKQKLRLGVYNLAECGKHFLEEVHQLNPKTSLENDNFVQESLPNGPNKEKEVKQRNVIEENVSRAHNIEGNNDKNEEDPESEELSSLSQEQTFDHEFITTIMPELEMSNDQEDEKVKNRTILFHTQETTNQSSNVSSRQKLQAIKDARITKPLKKTNKSPELRQHDVDKIDKNTNNKKKQLEKDNYLQSSVVFDNQHNFIDVIDVD